MISIRDFIMLALLFLAVMVLNNPKGVLDMIARSLEKKPKKKPKKKEEEEEEDVLKHVIGE